MASELYVLYSLTTYLTCSGCISWVVSIKPWMQINCTLVASCLLYLGSNVTLHISLLVFEVLACYFELALWVESCNYFVWFVIIDSHCSTLTAVDNGKMSCYNGSTYTNGESYEGDTCSFTCNTGYELTGSDNRTCQSDGSWSGSETSCRGRCFHWFVFIFICIC